MSQSLNLLEETIDHFNEGARSVRAYTHDTTYIITRIENSNDFWIALEEPGFPKKKASTLDEYFTYVFGIEAKY